MENEPYRLNPGLIRCIILALTLTAMTGARAQSGGVFTVVQAAGLSGGASTGGIFTVTGAVGRPAGASSGGNFVLRARGPGEITLIQTPGAPALVAARDHGGILISWPLPADGYVLEQATALDPKAVPWTPVVSPYYTNEMRVYTAEPSPNGHRFYRLRKP